MNQMPITNLNCILFLVLSSSLARAIHTIPNIPIGPNINLPMVSLGTGSGQKGNVTQATLLWLEAGGTGFDTAYDYEDEGSIAKGLQAANVKRTDLFITTKVPCGKYSEAKQHIADNLNELETEYVDLLLIHSDHPFSPPFDCNISATWKALEEAKEAGTALAIGVSHFSIEELKSLTPKPSVNQCSLSISYHDDETIQYCNENDIVYMSFSPLCGGANGSSCNHGSVLTIPAVISIAKVHKVQPAQVIRSVLYFDLLTFNIVR
jgi:diketogulonate reductase-like aldo/keto reductase